MGITPFKVLVSASLVLLIVTIYSVTLYGGLAYYLMFHRPLHWPQVGKPVAVIASLPKFDVTSSLSTTTLQVGQPETVTMEITSDKTVPSYIDVWAQSPTNEQLFESDTSGAPTTFKAHSSKFVWFSFTPTAKWPKGIYTVGEILTSSDTYTDYYVKQPAMRFTLQ